MTLTPIFHLLTCNYEAGAQKRLRAENVRLEVVNSTYGEIILDRIKFLWKEESQKVNLGYMNFILMATF